MSHPFVSRLYMLFFVSKLYIFLELVHFEITMMFWIENE